MGLRRLNGSVSLFLLFLSISKSMRRKNDLRLGNRKQREQRASKRSEERERRHGQVGYQGLFKWCVLKDRLSNGLMLYVGTFLTYVRGLSRRHFRRVLISSIPLSALLV
jgi:hypothetical protein